jgi:hypothetical protein
MNPPDPHQPDLLRPRPAALPTITVQELERRCHDLGTLLKATFVSLLVLSLSVNLYLAKQNRLVRGKLSESRPAVQRMAAEYRKKEPNMKTFLNALQTFAASNPDFQEVLNRYRTVMPQFFVAPVAVTSVPTSSRKVPSNSTWSPPGPTAPPVEKK